MILRTNRSTKNKHDLIKAVNLYLYRWRVEECFRVMNQEYAFENKLIIKFKAMNVLNLMITNIMNIIAILTEETDKNLLTMKIIE